MDLQRDQGQGREARPVLRELAKKVVVLKDGDDPPYVERRDDLTALQDALAGALHRLEGRAA